MKSLCHAGLVIFISIMTGCSAKKLENCQRLKVDDPKIIDFANKCANDYRDLTIYNQPKVIEALDHWSVLYDRKPNDKGLAPLGNFGIIINRKTCEGEFMPGS